MRKLEVISKKQFDIDFNDYDTKYDDLIVPKRNTKYAAGYDFYLPFDIELSPGEIIKIPTGIKACFDNDEVLLLVVRSSTGFKYNVRLCNQVGVIDADYYNNKDNEGHIWLKVQNHSDATIVFNKGDAIVQGIFFKYLVTDDDDNLGIERSSDY